MAISKKTSEYQREPQWYKDAIIYQLHVKAFFDSNNDGYGDFAGLIQKLDYVQDLGVNCLWLLPFYPSPLRDDGYDIADYTNVNQRYGTRKLFKQFLNEAHKRNIKVITELVVNHTSDQHPWFQAARKAPSGSNKRNYYVWSDTDQKYQDTRIIFTDTETSNWTWDPVAGAYYWHRFFSHQPDLNFDNPSVVKAVVRWMKFWFDMGVDGLRLDAVPYLIEREGTNCENLEETHQLLKVFRQEMDAKYEHRIFLAEANQWPSDVRDYFGEGDECHMAFHFPVMPRLFMAIHQEDRFPIVDIMNKTPDIPDNCQWAIFLRNHDELTLEMVTDEEREYLYKAYAAEPRMRINVGIRRRLAPLLQRSRRRIELMNSLLFSLPGTPILYYGDEIGMGDNIFLGDRDGVRTPMQWSSDRNGGFSKVDYARLYLPAIMDPIYGFQAVNVEAQELDSSSLLHWTRKIISLRRRYKVFGRGKIRFLECDNRKVLVFLREYEDEKVLVIANLSRYCQQAHIDLLEFQGYRPVEMFGLVEFSPITELPYSFTLGPHSFYWLLIDEVPITQQFQQVPAEMPPPVGVQEPAFESGIFPDALAALPKFTLNHEASWQAAFAGSFKQFLEGHVLPGYLAKQHWFMGKKRPVDQVIIQDWVCLPGGDGNLNAVTWLEVTYQDNQPSEFYLLGFSTLSAFDSGELISHAPEKIMALVKTGFSDVAVLYAASESDYFCHQVLAFIGQERVFKTQFGQLSTRHTPAFKKQASKLDVELPIQRNLREQRNTSVVFGDRYILKLFRRLQPGINPDYEISRFLREKANFAHSPQILGALEYTPVNAEGDGKPRTEQTITLGILQEWVTHQSDVWDYAVDELRRFYEQAETKAHMLETIQPHQGTWVEQVEAGVPIEAEELLGLFYWDVKHLAQQTAQLHLALASHTPGTHKKDPGQDFVSEPVTQDYLNHLMAEMNQTVDETLELLSQNLDELARQDEALFQKAQRVLNYHTLMRRIVDELSHVHPDFHRIRIHGDYHLAQVLRAGDNFVILDFEGDPAQPFSRRTQKQIALRDVAGMLRSLSYATYASLFMFSHNQPESISQFMAWALICQHWCSILFLDTYLSETEGQRFLPSRREDTMRLLECLVMEKACQQLRYELTYRMDWVSVPLNALLYYLEAKAERY